MTSSNFVRRLAVASLVLLTATACDRDLDSLQPAPFPSEPTVFGEDFVGVDFQAFAGSKTDAVQIDNSQSYRGSNSLRVTVPAPDNATGSYAGGAFVASVPRDLSGYNALTFWARANRTATLNVAGLGNDNTGTSIYTAEAANQFQLGSAWAKYVIPIPDPAKLSMEQGMFFFAEGAEEGQGYTFWMDEVRFEQVSGISNIRPMIPSTTINDEVGGSVRIQGATATYQVDGTDVTVAPMPAYFDFASSNTGVATVADDGGITLVGGGTATITATLAGRAASGEVTVVASAPPSGAAPTPTDPAGEVISLFSDAYTNVPVDTWSATWDNADVADVQIAGNAVKKYTNLVFAGIEFTSNPVNASDKGFLHMDVWVQDASSLKIKLVDFGADGAFGGGNDTEFEVALNPTSTPALQTGQWNSLEIPLSAFAGMGRSAIAQMIISGSSPTVYVDNVYFGGQPPVEADPEPTAPAPTPTFAAGSVVSMFSDAYTNVPVDTWSATWDNANVEDLQIAGNAVKKYTGLVFAGIEATSSPIDASSMTHFMMDFWTPDATATGVFKIKLVDFGADGAFGGGDDVEHEVTLTATSTPALATAGWVRLAIPLSDFAGLTTKSAIAQMIISGDPKTVWVDNVLFYNDVPAPTEPTTAAPTPTLDAANVVSLFSNAYTNSTVDTWSAGWDNADVADVQIAGDDTKKYTNLVFAGIEFTSAPVNASAMTHFHMDFWTPDATGSAEFKIKLVDFGPDGAFGGGDDAEHEITLTASTTPAIGTGAWASLDIPLSDFGGLTTRGAIAQLIISGTPNTVFLDNVYFHN